MMSMLAVSETGVSNEHLEGPPCSPLGVQPRLRGSGCATVTGRGPIEGSAGLDEAISLRKRTLADRERVLGPDHPDTLTARSTLAIAYDAAGRLDEAIPLFQHTLADSERVLGPDHPDTLATRSNLAAGYESAGRLDEAIPLRERSLADFERILGADHSDTLIARNNVAVDYKSAGRLDEAIPLYQRSLADFERVLGADHPDTRTACSNLAAAYDAAGRLDEAIPLCQRSLADSERVLGPDHPDTLTARHNLAVTYVEAGRLDEAVPLLERSLADRERVLGPDHPVTMSSRSDLAATHEAAKRLRRERAKERRRDWPRRNLLSRRRRAYQATCDAHRAAAAAARSTAPLVFAEARLALAELLMSHDDGNDEAITALEEALTVYRADEHPGPWFRCHWYLGQLLAGRAVSCSDLLGASAHLVDATTVKPPRVDAASYAQVCGELSGLLADRRCPVDWKRLDRALSWSEECLKYWPPDDLKYRMDHADGLARSYLIRAKTSHDDADHIRAAALLDQASQWARESGAPNERVIGLAIDAAKAHAMILTDRRQNLEIAIERLTDLRDQADRKTPAGSLAATQQSLGIVYRDRIAGDPAANMELAIENLEAALSAWDLDKNPDEWASVANDLANAYCRRISGNHSENMEQAIGYARAASVIRTRAKDAELWARTVHNLGSLYFQRPFGQKSENIETSISMSQAALEVETKDAFPARWAGAQYNLGNAYLQRVRGDRSDNLQAAVSCLRDALSIRSGTGDLDAQGASLLALGGALAALGTETHDQKALADAVTAYQQAAAAFEKTGAAGQRAMTYFNLAVILSQQPGADSAVRALEAARQCLPAWDAANNPLHGSRVYAMLADFTNQVGRTAEAYEWICRAIEAFEALYAGGTTIDSQIQVVEEDFGWYGRAIDLALRSGAPASDALLFAERGRARMLREASVRIQPDWNIPAKLLASETALEKERDQAWAGIRTVHPASAAVKGGFAQIWNLTERLAGLREQMRQFPGGNEYVAARKGSMSWDQIRRWVAAQPAGFALLEYVSLPDRVVAFVVRQDQPEPAVVEIPLDSHAVFRCAVAMARELDGSTAERVRKETWDRTADPLVTLVRPELAGVRLLCIVPHHLLHLPLHALGPARATLLDQMAVYYAPSAGLAIQLSQGVRRAGRTGRLRALVVGDSNGDLEHARQEAEQIAQILGVHPLIEGQATSAAVLAQLREADLAHFACHGYLRLWDPPLTAIRLANGEELTARQLQRTELSCDLLVLSGCDTGYEVGLETPGTAGLPSALIAAGARTAIASLWPVNDESTKELFTRFYTELTSSSTRTGDEGAEPPGGDEIARSIAGCLRVAELALRETRPERYYWAPFIAVGSW
jgi:CHAT domain-containing protein/tetratricopeptide (TPR) repeat protein